MAMDFMTIFWNLASGRETISLLNVYQGIPISYPATIINVGENVIQVITEKYQLVCLYHERETYIQSPEISEIIKAKVSGLDAATSTVILSDFEIVTKTIGERQEVRVCPKFSIEGEIQSQDLADVYQGELADISQSGMGIYINERDFFPRVYRPGRKLGLCFKLPGTYQIFESKGYIQTPYDRDEMARFNRSSLRYSDIHQPKQATDASNVRRLISPELTMQGTIANILELESQKRRRIGVRLVLDEFSRLVISQFIAQRQSEIIQEINAVYQLISEG
ncbi:MAG: hypothetical protein JW908_07695 [Anaerolineales bacterium]|nr:hypothetical protein [Anaerolineales bacterium]